MVTVGDKKLHVHGEGGTPIVLHGGREGTPAYCAFRIAKHFFWTVTFYAKNTRRFGYFLLSTVAHIDDKARVCMG